MDVPDIDKLEQIFSNAIAPSFFLGAVAAFMTLMMSQLASVNERIRATRMVSNEVATAIASNTELATLKRRSRLLSDGILLSIGGGICARFYSQCFLRANFLVSVTPMAQPFSLLSRPC